MNVLFISRENSKLGISPIIKNQGDSLKKQGVSIDYFLIKGKGVLGYFKSIFALKKHLKKQKYDIFHAHYSLSGFVAAFAGCKPLVVSLMGSDVKAKWYLRYVIKFFEVFLWDIVIIKSIDMKKELGKYDYRVIPNGVNIEKFKPIDKEQALNFVGWESSAKHILFASNPKRKEKNFKLVEDSMKLINDNIQIHYLKNIENKDVPYYLNAADAIILSSLWEGSPNVIKESMSCSRPIVSTKVGDVEWVLGNTDGCFVSSFKASEFSNKIIKALKYSRINNHTNGRSRIIKLNLDSLSISSQLTDIYNEII